MIKWDAICPFSQTRSNDDTSMNSSFITCFSSKSLTNYMGFLWIILRHVSFLFMPNGMKYLLIWNNPSHRTKYYCTWGVVPIHVIDGLKVSLFGFIVLILLLHKIIWIEIEDTILVFFQVHFFFAKTTSKHGYVRPSSFTFNMHFF